MSDTWPYLAVIVVTIALAMYVVPWCAARIARRDAERNMREPGDK